MPLSLSLLGVFQASLEGRPLAEFYSSKVRALLAYLAVEAGREHPRPLLATLLWPDWDDRAALSNLRFSLSKLRQAIDDQGAIPPFLLISRDTLRLNPAADVSVDVHLFQQELRASRWESVEVDGRPESTVRSAVDHLSAAMALYRGPFLEGFTVGDSAAFEEWALIQREQFEREARGALHGLTVLSSRLGDYAVAERAVRQLLDMDPWDEQANRHLMTMLVHQGQRNAALRHYASYRDEIAEELGCEPEEETQALYVQIRDGGLPQPPPVPLAASTSPGRRPPTLAVQPVSRFVAREQELARLSRLLDGALAGQGGMALIAGEAGSGKTALLDEFARRVGQLHGDLIVLRGSCNAHADVGDPYLPFREILQTLAGDVEGRRAGGTLSLDQARQVWEVLPMVGAALVEHGPDLIDTFVPGEALLQRIEGFPALSVSRANPSDLPKGPALIPAKGPGLPDAARWLPRLRNLTRRAAEVTAPSAGSGVLAPQLDLFAQVTQVLHAVSMGRPLLLTIDDLQWADSGTAALLFHLGRRLAGSRILLVCAYRPEALHGSPDLRGREPAVPPGLGDLGFVLQELARVWGDVLVDLDQADGRTFVEAYVDREPNRLGADFRQALYDHTGGNPLFTAELLRSFERRGALVQDKAGHWIEAPALDWNHVPARVEAIIAGHLAALPEEDRTLLQAASVQGEQFTAEVAARVLGWDEETTAQRLSGSLRTRHRLVEAVSLDRLASSGQRLSRYRFRHALVQGSAYRSLDAVARTRLHEATGRALEVIYLTEDESPSALAPDLARHFEAAGLPLEAARCRLEAGQWAVRLVAHDEAIAHLERGLVLLESVVASRERLHLELALLLALVNPAVLQQGLQSPTVKRALARLFELAQQPALQDDPLRLTALVLLALASTWSADPEHGRRVGEQLLALFPSASSGQAPSTDSKQAPTKASGQAPSVGSGQAQDGDQPFLMHAHWILGHSHLLQGQFTAAREHLGQALALHDPGASGPLDLPFLGNPGAMGRALLGHVQWMLGYLAQSRASISQALAYAQEIEQPSTTAFVHAAAGALYSIGRDEAETLKHVQALRTLGETGEFYLAWAEMWTGPEFAAVLKSEPPQDSPQTEEAKPVVKDMGSVVGQGMQFLAQAQKLVRAGQPAMALEAVDRALAWIERTGVRLLEAEVWRVRGELLLAVDDGPRPMDPGWPEDDSAEDCLQHALVVARAQQARWLELRASVSLARLWQAQSRRAEAHELLTGIYGWFTEGFDTVDLIEAKALLEELA